MIQILWFCSCTSLFFWMGEILIHSKSSVYASHNMIPLLLPTCAGFGNIWLMQFLFYMLYSQPNGQIFTWLWSGMRYYQSWIYSFGRRLACKYKAFPTAVPGLSLLSCIQQWCNTLPTLDLCLNLATKLPLDMLYAGRLNPFMAEMKITLLLATVSLNKWKQEAVWFSFGKGTLLP